MIRTWPQSRARGRGHAFVQMFIIKKQYVLSEPDNHFGNYFVAFAAWGCDVVVVEGFLVVEAQVEMASAFDVAESASEGNTVARGIVGDERA